VNIDQYVAFFGAPIVKQRLVYDLTNNRLRTDFYVSKSFPSPWSQIGRYDVDKLYEIVGVPGFQNCTVRDIKGQLTPFFDMPSTASYNGTADIGGVKCDVWVYEDMGSEFKFYATQPDSADGEYVPVRVEAVGDWYADYSDFESGVPPLSEYDLPQGVICSD
jgi:hypothetical protein